MTCKTRRRREETRGVQAYHCLHGPADAGPGAKDNCTRQRRKGRERRSTETTLGGEQESTDVRVTDTRPEKKKKKIFGTAAMVQESKDPLMIKGSEVSHSNKDLQVDHWQIDAFPTSAARRAAPHRTAPHPSGCRDHRDRQPGTDDLATRTSRT